MAQLIQNSGKWWLMPGASVLNTIEMTIQCSNMHDATSVKNIWEERQYENFYKDNCYGWRHLSFYIHDATIVELINETTVQVAGLVAGQDFLFKIYLLLHELPFVKAQIKCKDDRNPRRVSIWNPKKRQEILIDDIVSVYVFEKINDHVVLL